MTTRPRKKIPAALRTAILARDGKRCVYCGVKASKKVALTLDHVIPHSHGGPDTALNLVSACGECNNRRSTMPIDLYAEWLRRLGFPGAAERVLHAISLPLPE